MYRSFDENLFAAAEASPTHNPPGFGNRRGHLVRPCVRYLVVTSLSMDMEEVEHGGVVNDDPGIQIIHMARRGEPMVELLVVTNQGVSLFSVNYDVF